MGGWPQFWIQAVMGGDVEFPLGHLVGFQGFFHERPAYEEAQFIVVCLHGFQLFGFR